VDMMPTVVAPGGDPAGVRAGAQRLERAAGEMRVVSDRLAVVDEEATRVWQSGAQRLFTTLASSWVQIAAGAADILTAFVEALVRYASVLESCQAEVRQAQHRLQVLVASTPVGFQPDAGAVAAIVGQAQQAVAAAEQAARQLASTASEFIGPVGEPPGPSVGVEAGASFVSRSHALSGEVVSTAPGQAFDAQAAVIEQQLRSTLDGMVGIGPTAATHATGGSLVGGVDFGSGITSGANAGTGGSMIGGIDHGFPNSGPTYNPTVRIAEVIENQQRRSAETLWNRIAPGVAPPATDAAGVRRAILDRLDESGPNPDPLALAGVGILNDGAYISTRIQLLQPGYTLVRRDYP
jgi:hypothetical protein